MADNEQELASILTQLFNDGFILGELGTGDEQESIGEAQNAIKAMGYVKWDRGKVAKVVKLSREGVKVSSNGIANFMEYPTSSEEIADQLREMLTGVKR